jgi:hypothetical protein
MGRRLALTAFGVFLAVGLWALGPTQARAQYCNPQTPLCRQYYYPYYYFPHNYWPSMSAPYPERPGAPYMPPPAYMAYPPYIAPGWRYEWYQPQLHYQGSHFWLDIF